MTMTYREAVEYVQQAALFNSKKDGLNNILHLLERLGNPQDQFRCVHVAGTNGKGSVCACIDAALRAAGYRTALYTSPYLERFNERMAVDGAYIPDDVFAEIASLVRACAQAMVDEGGFQPTFFELTTACAFLWFAQENVDIAVLETGLGGTLDATNVVHPQVCCITSIGLDHTAALGNTLMEIATQKAGIIKPGIPCVLSGGIEDDIAALITGIARERGAPVISGAGYAFHILEDGLRGQRFAFEKREDRGELAITLAGAHQRINAISALLTCRALRERGFDRLDETAIHKGFAQARWKGRLELLRDDPPVLIDGAHNPQGAQALRDALEIYLPGRPITLVMGALGKKNYTDIARILAPAARRIIATQPTDDGKSLPAAQLGQVFDTLGYPCECYTDLHAALDRALGIGYAVVVAGSLYLAGATRTYLAGG